MQTQVPGSNFIDAEQHLTASSLRLAFLVTARPDPSPFHFSIGGNTISQAILVRTPGNARRGPVATTQRTTQLRRDCDTATRRGRSDDGGGRLHARRRGHSRVGPAGDRRGERRARRAARPYAYLRAGAPVPLGRDGIDRAVRGSRRRGGTWGSHCWTGEGARAEGQLSL